jgi:hypothetical protein
MTLSEAQAIQSQCSVHSNSLLYSPAKHIEATALLFFQALGMETALPEYILCINRLPVAGLIVQTQ